jgi:curved DNA-binding protein CbpA
LNDLPRKDYYGILRLPPGTSPEIVRQRFKRLARQLHPDVNRSPDAAERFREIREAYEVLSDPAKRRLVDTWYEPVRGREFRRARREGRLDTERAGPIPSNRPLVVHRAPWWADLGSEAVAGFGCFGLPAAAVALAYLAYERDEPFESAFWIAITVGLVVGLAATLGGARFRETLLWILREAWELSWWGP